MYLSETYIEDLLTRVNIYEVVSKYIRLEKKCDLWFGKCPFHDGKYPSFMVDEKAQKYYCFSCGEGGNVINFLMKYHKISFPEAAKILDPEMEDIKAQEKTGISLKVKRMVQMNQIAVKLYRKLYETEESAKAYADMRELSKSTIDKFQIGYSGEKGDSLYKELKQAGFSDSEIKDSGLITFYEMGGVGDKFSERFMFPIQNIDGTIIGFGGRLLSDPKQKKKKGNAPKYLNSPETLIFDKSSNLFGLNFAKESKKDYFILCEGYMDVISLHQAGFTNAVASLGTALTEHQARLLSLYKKKIVIAYDSDAPGITASKKALNIFGMLGMELRFVDMNPYKDPDEFIKAQGVKEYEVRIKNALNKNQWILKQAIALNDVKMAAELLK